MQQSIHIYYQISLTLLEHPLSPSTRLLALFSEGSIVTIVVLLYIWEAHLGIIRHFLAFSPTEYYSSI